MQLKFANASRNFRGANVSSVDVAKDTANTGTSRSRTHQAHGELSFLSSKSGFRLHLYSAVYRKTAGLIVRTVPAADLQQTFDEMELTLDLASAVCPHCGAVNLFPGFSEVMAFACKGCWAASTVRR